jgi:hypothetical protein
MPTDCYTGSISNLMAGREIAIAAVQNCRILGGRDHGTQDY